MTTTKINMRKGEKKMSTERAKMKELIEKGYRKWAKTHNATWETDNLIYNLMGNPKKPIKLSDYKKELKEYNPLKEVELVIKSWLPEFGLKKTWVKNLHPADILEKHVFPAIAENYINKKELRGEIEKGKKDTSVRKRAEVALKFRDKYTLSEITGIVRGYNQAIEDILKLLK